MKDFFISKKLRYFLIYVFLFLFISACQTQLDVPARNHQATRPDIREIMLDGETIRYEAIGDDAVIEGDIILGSIAELENNLLQPQGIKRDSCFKWAPYRFDHDCLWPNGVIPYTWDSDVNIGQIELALKHWEERTPIRFVRRTNEIDYVSFVRGDIENACFSEVGRVGGKQRIRLSPSGRCDVGSLIHEIGHTVGLLHEHQRSDRNEYVEILWDNVDPDRKSNFELKGYSTTDLGQYDYHSVMHYGTRTFCKLNSSGVCLGDTLQVLEPNIVVDSGVLSHGDIATVNALYAEPSSKRIVAINNSNVCLHKKNNNWTNGNPIVLGACSDKDPEFKTWDYEPSTGYIRSFYNPKKCLHKDQANWNNGNPVHIWDCDAGSETFKAWDYDASTGFIKARFNPDMCLHKTQGNWNTGNPIHLWRCDEGHVNFKSWSMAVNVGIQARENSAQCFNRQTNSWKNGTLITLGACTYGNPYAEQFVYETMSGYLRSVSTPSKCIHKKNSGWNNGNSLHLWDCDAGSASFKSWTYESSTGYIKARYNFELCIHKTWANWAVGNPAHLWQCNEGSQAFKSWDLVY